MLKQALYPNLLWMDYPRKGRPYSLIVDGLEKQMVVWEQSYAKQMSRVNKE
jgi:hypothetical protein